MTKTLGTLVALASLALAGCAANYDENDIFNTGEEVLSFDHGDLWALATESPIDGTRYAVAQYRRGMLFYIDTTARPGHAYTTWVCGFNNPSACSGGDVMVTESCDLYNDLLTPGPQDPFCQAGAGEVAAEDGSLFMVGNQDSTEVIIGNGLTDTENAEVYFVVRDHGPAMEGADLEAQLTTFMGGCDVHECIDEQVSMSKMH